MDPAIETRGLTRNFGDLRSEVIQLAFDFRF
jgi:hypothetical protein